MEKHKYYESSPKTSSIKAPSFKKFKKWAPPAKKDSISKKNETIKNCGSDNVEESLSQAAFDTTQGKLESILITKENNVFTQKLSDECRSQNNFGDYIDTEMKTYNQNDVYMENHSINSIRCQVSDTITPSIDNYDNDILNMPISPPATIDIEDNIENSPLNMYSAFMMSFGLDPSSTPKAKVDVNYNNYDQQSEDIILEKNYESYENILDLGLMSKVHDVGTTDVQMKCETVDTSSEKKASVGKKKSSINSKKRTKKTKAKLEKTQKSFCSKKSSSCAVSNEEESKPTNMEEKMTIHSYSRNILPFTGNYKLAEERNKLRLAHQIRTGEFAYYNLRINKLALRSKKQIKHDMQKEIADMYEYAVALCELTISILKNLEIQNETKVLDELEAFFEIIVTSKSQKLVPQFLLVVKMIRGCEEFHDSMRKMAQKCYDGCRAMYGVPTGKTFESLFVDQVKVITDDYEMVDVLQKLLEPLDETFVDDSSEEDDNVITIDL